MAVPPWRPMETTELPPCRGDDTMRRTPSWTAPFSESMIFSIFFQRGATTISCSCNPGANLHCIFAKNFPPSKRTKTNPLVAQSFLDCSHKHYRTPHPVSGGLPTGQRRRDVGCSTAVTTPHQQLTPSGREHVRDTGARTINKSRATIYTRHCCWRRDSRVHVVTCYTTFSHSPPRPGEAHRLRHIRPE